MISKKRYMFKVWFSRRGGSRGPFQRRGSLSRARRGSESAFSIVESAPTNGHLTAGAIAARLEQIAADLRGLEVDHLLSFGFFFELYDLLFTGNIAPGLAQELANRLGIIGARLSATSTLNDVAASIF
jgi:hypothetical protein